MLACDSHIPPENWTNIVFHDCTARIKWRLVDGTKGKTVIVTEDGKYTQAKECNDMQMYHSLDVILEDKGGSCD